MIVKLTKGKGFRGLVNYLTSHPDDTTSGRGRVIAGNMSGTTPMAWSREFANFRKLRPQLGKAVFHASLSLPPTERFVSDTEFEQVGQDFLCEMGFDDCPYLIVRHDDTEHAHIHIVSSRINCRGEVVSDKNDFRRAESIARKLEEKYLLSTVPSNNKNKENPMTDKPEDQKRQDFIMQRMHEACENTEAKHGAVPMIEVAYAKSEAKKRRDIKRRLLEEAYAREIEEWFIGRLAYVDSKQIPLALHFKIGGRVQDHGDKMFSYGMTDESAAEMLVELAIMKGWSGIRLRGSDDFLRQAMRLAQQKGLSIDPIDDHQRRLLEELVHPDNAMIEERQPGRVLAPFGLLTGAKQLGERLRKREEERDNEQTGPRHTPRLR